MRINLPRDLDTSKSLAFADLLSTIPKEEEITFYPQFKWARPFGMLITMTAMRQMRKKYADTPFYLNSVLGPAGSYAGYMGFFKGISDVIPIGNVPGSVSGNDRYMPITKISMKELRQLSISQGYYEEDGEILERKAKGLSEILVNGNKELMSLFTHAIREMLRNVPEHSGADDIWICGQSWPQNHTAEIAVLDEGMGITQSLIHNAFYSALIRNDEDALKFSILPGVSQSFTPGRQKTDLSGWGNSGFGLYVLSELCERLNGSFCIASGNRYLQKEKGIIRVGPTYLKGTAVRILIDTTHFDSFRKINTDIIKTGESIAKKNANAIHRASRPSRGLMIEE